MSDASDDETFVIVAGLCNTYSDYITTPEEYQVNCSLLLLSISNSLENRGDFEGIQAKPVGLVIAIYNTYNIYTRIV